jgi:uracil-DNA glycosylase
VVVLWVGAAPGNAGGLGMGALGAHGTRIPFGGDIAGANLDVMLGAIGRTRNDSFITASLNSLPARGGGEPAVAEMRAAVGAYPSSIHLLADTILAAAPRLIIALGNVALRAVHGAFRTEGDRFTLPTLKRLMRAGLERNHAAPLDAAGALPEAFARRWNADTRARPLPTLLWLTHPSAQNMSPHARVDTAFHSRMVEALGALRRTARGIPDIAVPEVRPDPPRTGIYALPEWRELIAPRHATLDALWREKGV